MRKRALLATLMALLVSCGQSTNIPTPSPSPTNALPGNRVFEFVSSGAYHPEGLGAWLLQLDAEGVLSITHDLRGELTTYGPFTLSERENSDFWDLVDDAHLEHRDSSTRPGVPDEIMYTFVLSQSDQRHEVEIWANDVQEDTKLAALVEAIEGLIQAHAQDPLLSTTSAAQTWEADPVLIEFGIYREDPAPFGVSHTPHLLLYADGRLVIHSDEGLQETHLTRQEICALLNTIEQAGFFDVDIAAFQEGIDQLGLGLVSTTAIEVNAWQSRGVNVDALWEATDHLEVEVPTGLRVTFEVLRDYRPDNLTPFQSEQLAVVIYRYPADDGPEGAGTWSLDAPSLEEMFAQATVESRQQGQGLLLEGEVATRVEEEIHRADELVFAENGSVYSVSARPLLPCESLESAVSYRARIPSRDVDIAPTTLTCYASDGVLDIAALP